MTEFIPFPKVPRLYRDVVITEKLDGTNACVYVEHHYPTLDDNLIPGRFPSGVHIVGEYKIRAGSRSRWISPESDNFGFALWVKKHAEELVKLGPGFHYGEWWGVGIQRGYDMSERRFSLFNTHRWADPAVRPSCCHVVPVLYQGTYDAVFVGRALAELETFGSAAAPGYTQPEGVMVYHEAAKQYFKATLGGDGHKEQAAVAA